MKKIFIFKTGETFAECKTQFGDFDEWIKNAIQLPTDVVEIVSIDVLAGEPLPQFKECLAVIITGSHAMVSERLDWSVEIETWLQQSVPHAVPVLGICYGHQLIAQAFGGKVDFHPQGIEVGTVEIECNRINAAEDALFATKPRCFFGQVTHSQSVIQLPANAVNLACNSHEPNQAYRIGDRIWGVQFHPEFPQEVMPAYINNQIQAIDDAGLDKQTLLEQVRSTPEATALLQQFVDFAVEHAKS